MLENVELAQIYNRMPRKERRQRAVNALERVGLSHRLSFTPRTLSGGERQRVAVARALVTEPSLLLADEPTGNLDQKNSTIVIDLLCRMAREKGQTILVVTHNHAIADACDQNLPMLDGVFAAACGTA